MNCRRMLHHHVSFYETLGRTYFLSRRNVVWRDCRRLEKQEVHAEFSFAFGAAIFHREPFATLLEGQNVHRYGGLSFKKGYLFCLNGKVQPLDV